MIRLVDEMANLVAMEKQGARHRPRLRGSFGLLVLWNSYGGGGFSRPRTNLDLVLSGALGLVVILLWSLVWTYVLILAPLAWLSVIPR